MPSNEERVMLRDSLRGLLEQHWPAGKALAASTHPDTCREIWRRLAELGITSLCRNPDEGGLRELVVVLEELGRAHCPVPLLDKALLNRALLLMGSASGAVILAAATDDAKTIPVLSFADTDADPQAGSISFANGTVSGFLNFVDGGLVATHLFVFADAGRHLLIIRREQAGVVITPTRAMGHDGLCRVDLINAAAQHITCGPALAVELTGLSRLGLAARAWGAANRSFEMATDYVKQRRQFGQVIGRYQAVQHKLADILIYLQSLRHSIENAAEHVDQNAGHAPFLVAAACALANTSLREVSLQTHHAFGAIGYAEDHEAPRHFKRVHLDVLRHGAGRADREALAAYFLDGPVRAFPDYDLGAAGNLFRHEVRTWLAQNWRAEDQAAHETRDTTHREWDADFARALGKTGWLAANWPRRFGGQERSPLEMLALTEELARVSAPRAGAPIQAASWIDFGTSAQQARYLPEIASGEVMYGMWYSEPDAGSDLAALRTRAVREGDEWVINGQKIWTTTYWGQYMWLAARTDPQAKPAHAGITMFVVRTDTPGITRTPIRTMYDGEFCNTFFDNVRVPADAVVGEVNGGWAVLTGSLGVERAYIGADIIMKTARQFEELCEFLRTAQARGVSLRKDPLVRDAVGRFAARIEAGRRLAYECVALLAQGQTPTYEAAITKVYAGELMEQFNEAAMDMLGMQATLSAGSPQAPLHGRLEQKLRHSLMWVISLGTNEIQRSLIAQRALELPR